MSLFLFFGIGFSQVLAAEEERTFVGQVGFVITEVFRQMDGVTDYAAQAFNAVFDNSVRVDERQEPVGETGIAIPDPLPISPTRFPLQGVGLGTLVINAPLSITSTLNTTGESNLATTTVTGLLSADELALDALSVSGLVSAGALSGGTLNVTGAGSFGSVDTAGTVSAAELAATGGLTAAEISISGQALVASLLVQGATQLTGLLEADGGIQTNGANVDLGDGQIFASNIVNEVVAGAGVTISGTTSAPVISVDLEGVVTEINGESGEVDLRGGDDIRVSGLRISNTSDLSSVVARGGCSGCLTDADVSNTLTLTGGSIDNVVIGSSTPALAFFSETTVGTTTSATTTFRVLGSGTSNFGGSVNIDSGCFSIAGVCVASAASSTSYVGLADTPSALIAGAIQFANASGTELVQSADFVFDGSSLAIGTTTAGETLTVDGGGSFNGNLTITGSTTISDEINAGSDINVGGNLIANAPVIFNDSLTVTGLTALGANLTVGGTTTISGGLNVVGITALGNDLSVDGDIAAENGGAFLWYDADSSNYVALRASSTLSGNTIWTLPTSDGFADQILVTDGSGNLRFESVSAVGGGVSEYVSLLDTPSSFASGTIPYTNASGTALTQSSNFTFDGTRLSIGPAAPTAELTVDGSVNFVAADGAIDFVYDDASKLIGIGTENPTEKLTVLGGDFSQRGGATGNLYTPSLEGITPLDDDGFDVQVFGGYAYVVSEFNGDDFQIFDIGDTLSPVELGSLNLPTRGNALEINGRYAYVVSGFSGDDFHVIDISDPNSPTEIDSIGFSASANDLAIKGRYAYVVTDGSTSNFKVIDISDPFNVVEVASTSLPTNTTSIALFGDYAFAVSEVFGDDVHSIDISDPLNPTLDDGVNLPDTANTIVLSPSGQYAYVGTNSSGDDVHVIDISDPTNMVLGNELDIGAGVTDLVVAGDILYGVSLAAGQDFHVIDISNPANVVLIGGRDLGAGNAFSLDVVSRYAYIGTGSGLAVVNVTGAQMQSVFTNSFEASRVFVSGESNFADDIVVQGEFFAGANIQSIGSLQVNGTDGSYIAGTLSVGTTSSSTAFTVDGTMLATNLLGGATNVTTDANGNIIRDPSDIRLKTNVTTVDGALDALLQLRGVRYNWIDTERFGSQTEIGFIAQEVDLILPEVVRKGGDYWSINTRNILAVVVEAVKEVWVELQGTQSDVAALEERLGVLESQVGGVATTTPVQSISQNEEPAEEDTEESSSDENDTSEQANENSDTTETPQEEQTDTVPVEETGEQTATSTETIVEVDDAVATSTEPVVEEVATSTDSVVPETEVVEGESKTPSDTDNSEAQSEETTPSEEVEVSQESTPEAEPAEEEQSEESLDTPIEETEEPVTFEEVVEEVPSP